MVQLSRPYKRFGLFCSAGCRLHFVFAGDWMNRIPTEEPAECRKATL
ncbi:hypothetical protein HMPREF9141_2805 [Prevotella multiformis DSM 16608]|uniref:Uncharacterized protein n=1 Tax=Prevotella multiformis DSM 16608 TaxID=888743 RepID=F0FB38_9BACT|nr:hypothetical protein HMPREF9141_2805 [Prevotella multiformis DSM 16608]